METPFYTRFADIKRLQFILNFLNENYDTSASVLDIGCGNGVISLNLAKAGYQVHGIDVSEKAIQKASENNQFSNARFEAISAEKLQASGVKYDVVICSEVLEHLDEPSILLNTLSEMLSEKGRLVVTVPNGKGPRESLVTRPILKMRSGNGFSWRVINGIKNILGYNGTTVQSSADNLDHVQFFTKKALQELSKSHNFKIEKFNHSNFIDDVFPVSLITRKSLSLQKFDAKIADKLPSQFVGGFFTVWTKSKLI